VPRERAARRPLQVILLVLLLLLVLDFGAQCLVLSAQCSVLSALIEDEDRHSRSHSSTG